MTTFALLFPSTTQKERAALIKEGADFLIEPELYKQSRLLHGQYRKKLKKLGAKEGDTLLITSKECFNTSSNESPGYLARFTIQLCLNWKLNFRSLAEPWLEIPSGEMSPDQLKLFSYLLNTVDIINQKRGRPFKEIPSEQKARALLALQEGKSESYVIKQVLKLGFYRGKALLNEWRKAL